MSFNNLDHLYRNCPDAYLQLLRCMTKEFESTHWKFEVHLRENDLTLFSQLKHKIFSTLNTLEYKEFIGFLEEVKSEMLAGGVADLNARLLALDRLFLKAYNGIGEKINELSLVSTM